MTVIPRELKAEKIPVGGVTYMVTFGKDGKVKTAEWPDHRYEVVDKDTILTAGGEWIRRSPGFRNVRLKVAKPKGAMSTGQNFFEGNEGFFTGTAWIPDQTKVRAEQLRNELANFEKNVLVEIAKERQEREKARP